MSIFSPGRALVRGERLDRGSCEEERGEYLCHGRVIGGRVRARLGVMEASKHVEGFRNEEQEADTPIHALRVIQAHGKFDSNMLVKIFGKWVTKIKISQNL